ncbi:PREDICTED: proline dehydrogenase 2, mitochondrial-like [Ipomoea nil]|uniref:proline dehydrogenase 2, mitochondrial-like n=1 Tax=Ipomoea nil TaxID=35883 RepID=UPI000900BA2C|nr:PREDICTED: proline dehydrogenase 2, mitochondrial-like [Ipomoea nil]
MQFIGYCYSFIGRERESRRQESRSVSLMASRVGNPGKIAKSLPRFVRRLNSAPSSFTTQLPPPLNFAEKPDPTPAAAAAKSVLDFEDAKELFLSVRTSKLVKSAVALHVLAIEPAVDAGIRVMNSRLMEIPVVRETVMGLVERTFYGQFCAGRDLEEVARTVAGMSETGIKAMLDYGSEHSHDNESCDRSMNDILQTVDSAKSLPPVSFVVLKITAICPPKLLKRVSDLLRWEYKNPAFNLPWKQKSLPVLSDSSALYHTSKTPEPLTQEEERDLELGHERLQKICRSCLEAGVPLLVDAEDTTVQPAIDYMTYSAAVSYYKDDGPLVFGTVQAYLKDAKERLVAVKMAAGKMGIPIGFKLVRGAYMTSESGLASALGAGSPIHDTIHNTHKCYNDCASFMLEEIAAGSGAVVIATHNIESGKLAATKAIDLGIKRDNQKLQFAQLYGMSEGLSFGLKKAGFQVSKYLPFGPVDQIMPYLLRRAEENRGLLSASSLDRQLMRKELKRRLASIIL